MGRKSSKNCCVKIFGIGSKNCLQTLFTPIFPVPAIDDLLLLTQRRMLSCLPWLQKYRARYVDEYQSCMEKSECPWLVKPGEGCNAPVKCQRTKIFMDMDR